jgi:HK97 family phage prohead protease
MSKKLRFYSDCKIERRAVGENSGDAVLTGLFCPYNVWSQPIGFRERFLPGAFTDYTTRDIACTVQHDLNRLLGRTSSRTLTISDSPEGMRAECVLPNTTFARDLLEQVGRGDVRGMSFDFICLEDQWEYDGPEVRRSISKAELYEVCFCPDPVYLHTEVELEYRSKLAAQVLTPTTTTQPPGLNCSTTRAKIAEVLFKISGG